MAASALLFDLDGTIWDSWPWYSRILQTAAGVSPEVVLGELSGGRSIVSLSHRCGISKARFIDLCREATPQLALYAGVKDTLVRLTERRVTLGVVTNLPEWLAAPILRGVSLEPLLRIQKYAAGKPSPRGLNTVLDRLPSSRGEAYYVGDSDADEEAARGAGVPFAWAAYGYGRHAPHDVRLVLREFHDALSL